MDYVAGGAQLRLNLDLRVGLWTLSTVRFSGMRKRRMAPRIGHRRIQHGNRPLWRQPQYLSVGENRQDAFPPRLSAQWSAAGRLARAPDFQQGGVRALDQ